MTPTLREIEARLDRVLAAHGGGLEVAGIAGSTVTVRFTGMCTGCPMRPVTAAWTVRPALLATDGITEVRIAGSRISAEAEERLARALGPDRPGVLGAAVP